MGNVAPFNVHGSKFIAGHVVLHTMEFLEDTEEVVKVFQSLVFTTKVVYNKAELDGSPFVGVEVAS